MIKPLLTILDGNPVFITTPPAFEPGFNRNSSMSMLSADDDWAAVLEYLNEFKFQVNTLENYLKEVERFLLFLIHEKQKPISAVNRADWLSYIEFIKEPPAHWCAANQKKFLKDGISINPCWRPFDIRKVHEPLATKLLQVNDNPTLKSGLGKSSQNLSKRIIESMFAFLVVSDYLNASPAMSSKSRNKTAQVKKSFTDRTISLELVDYTVDALFNAQKRASNSAEAFKFMRARYIIQLLLGTGLRLSEAACHTYGNIKIKNDKWYLDIVGKGDKERSIELFDDVVSVMQEFRLAMGCNSTPLFNDPMMLIPSNKPNKSVTQRRIIQIVRESFDMACREKIKEAEKEKSETKKGMLLRDASYLEKASAHWLRHAHATEFLKQSGQNLKATMQRLGHADVNVTMLYIHESEE